MNARPAIPASQLFSTVRRLHAAHWVNATCAALLAAVALADNNTAIAAGAVLAAAVVFTALHARITGLYRTRLDPCRSVGAADITDVSLLLDYYTQAADGPEALRFPFLPPLTGKRAIARRAGNPWWAPRGNLAYAGRISNARCTVLMPFLVATLTKARDEWNAGPQADAGAVKALRLRETWSDDILRQQARDHAVRNEAAAAWLLLEL